MRADEFRGLSVVARQANHNGPLEMSVAMKRIIFLFALLLAVPALSVGQAQNSTAVRDRVVGSNRANHVAKQKTSDGPASTPNPLPGSSAPFDQNRSEPRWGNTAVVVRPGANDRTRPSQTSTTDKQRGVN